MALMTEPDLLIADEPTSALDVVLVGQRMREALLSVRNLSVGYPASGADATVAAVTGVNLELRAGESLGIVGESGSGKTTLARAILGLVRPDEGEIWWRGHRLDQLPKGKARAARRGMQVIFQSPSAAAHMR